MTIVGFPQYHTRRLSHPARRGELLRRTLLVFGILTPPLYVAINLLGAAQWENYSFASQAVSELSAIGAPSRSLLLWLGAVYDLFVLAFALGVWRSAGSKRSLRITAASLFGTVVVDTLFRFAPMHMRGTPPTLTDTMHIVLSAAISLCILLAVASSAAAFGRWFRVFAISSILTMLVTGAWTAFEARGVSTNAPTPLLGLMERVDIGAYLLWTAVLAVVLLTRRDAAGLER
jgi:hypothetical protein